MRGLVCDGQSARLRTDLPEPTPIPGEVTIKVRQASICDTDLQLARGYMGFRGILGHEFVGETREGRRVVAEINNACQACSTCLAGAPGHCPNRTVLGIYNHDGAMADRVAIPERNLHEVPDSVSDRQAVFVEPLAAAFRIAEQIPLGPGTKMAILGDGKLGLLCAWAARLTGVGLTLIGKHPDKLALAGPGIETVRLEDVDRLGRPFDVVADCTGSPTGLPTALRLVRPLGTMILKTTVAGTYTVDLAPIVIDEIRVVGSRCGPFPRALKALASGEVDVTPLIGHEFPFDEAEAAFEAAGRRGARKVILQVS